MSAFGKVNYDPTSRLHTSFSVLWTPTTSTGFLPAYNGIGAERDFELEGIEPGRTDARVRAARRRATPARSTYTLTNSSLISVRAGLFDDNYKDTGVPTISSVDYQTSNIGLRLSDSRRPARRRELPEHAAHAARRISITPSAAT